LTAQLLNRSIALCSPAEFKRSSTSARFNRFTIQSATDVNDAESLSQFAIPFLRRRSKIIEISMLNDIIFALTSNGVCGAYKLKNKTISMDEDDYISIDCSDIESEFNSLERLCFLNCHTEEVVRSIFLNKAANAIITVSVYQSDDFIELKCRHTPIQSILKKEPQISEKLFCEEELAWPGFVEFDDANKKIVTCSAASRIYKVWNLADYQLLYAISDTNLEEVKVSPGIMLIIYKQKQMHSNTGAANSRSVMNALNRSVHKSFVLKRNDMTIYDQISKCKSYVPLAVRDISSGKQLASFTFPLYTDDPLEFVEQFNERLLIKQKGKQLNIVDIRYEDDNLIVVPENEFATPNAFVFLYEQQLFLTFANQTIKVFNFRGEIVTEFEDHQLYHINCTTNNIYINTDQDLIISYCRTKSSSNSSSEDADGAIHISHILTGKCVSKIEAEIDSSDDYDDMSDYLTQAQSINPRGRRVQNHRNVSPPSYPSNDTMNDEFDDEMDSEIDVFDTVNELSSPSSVSPQPISSQTRSSNKHSNRNATNAPGGPNYLHPYDEITHQLPNDALLPISSVSDLESVADMQSEALETALTSEHSIHNAIAHSSSANLLNSSNQDHFNNPIDECYCPFDQSKDRLNRLEREQRQSKWRLQIRMALRGITSLYYNEERNEIYTGNRAGFVHVWGNP